VSSSIPPSWTPSAASDWTDAVEPSQPRDFLAEGLSRKAAWVASVAVFLIALWVRLCGIGWGLPTEARHQSFHPDELLISRVADTMPYFRPGFYNYGTLYLTLLKLSADMGRTYGWVHDSAPPATGGETSSSVQQWETDRDIHRSGRLISAIAGAGTVALTFATLLGLTGVLGASLGAIALAVAPGHVVHSRFQTTDVLATFFVALSLFLILRMLAGKNVQLWAGVAIGLAAGTKYAGALLLIPLFMAIYWQDRRLLGKPLLFALSGFCAAFIIATPGVLLEPAAFWSGFSYEMTHSSSGHGIVFANTTSGFIYHLQNLVTAFGVAPLIVGLAALAWAATRGEKWAIALAAFFLAYYAVIGSAEVKFMRYVLPLLPALSIAIGFAAGEFHRRGGVARVGTGLIVLLVGLSVIAPTGAIQLTAFMQSDDPRDQAAAWLQDRQGSVGLVSDPWFYSPPLFADIGLLSPVERLQAMSENPRIKRYLAPDGTRKDWDPRLIDELQPDYIVFSSFEFIDNDRINLPDLAAFIDDLGKRYRLAAVFWGSDPVIPAGEEANLPVTRELLRAVFYSRFPLVHDMMYIQPTLCVFQRK
jgi:hypothetical protein